MELPRQFSQLVLFVLDGSNSMTWDGTSGFSKGHEIHQSVVEVLERLQSSKNKASFDIGFWAFANESKEMYPIQPLKEYDLKKNCFNPCEFINEGDATYLSETLQSVENVVNDYLDKHKDLNRKALIILLGIWLDVLITIHIIFIGTALTNMIYTEMGKKYFIPVNTSQT